MTVAMPWRKTVAETADNFELTRQALGNGKNTL